MVTTYADSFFLIRPVPAKAAEAYLDARRAIEEQVRVGILFLFLALYLGTL